MTIENISTYAVFQSTLSDVSKVETELNKAQMQLSSGNNSPDFTGMAAQTPQYLSVQAILARTQQYMDDNQVVSTRLTTTSSMLDQVINTATSLQNLISQRRTDVSSSSTFNLQITNIWKTLVGQLNTNVNGEYIFSGTKTTSPAVDDQHFPSLAVENTPDDGYYLGSKQDISVRAQDNVSFTYNVRADADGFKKIFAGLAMANDGDIHNSDSKLAMAYDFVQQGLQGVIAAQATVNANKVQLSTIDQNNRSVKLYWQGIRDSINNTDVVAVSTQVAINQGILQAAFQAFAKITSLRLSDYLK